MAIENYDIHCHLFNKDLLKSELQGRIIKIIQNILPETGSNIPYINRFSDPEKGCTEVEEITRSLRRIAHFLEIGFMKDSIEIFGELQKTYKNKLAVVSLMFDLEYCFGDDLDLCSTDTAGMWHEVQEAVQESFNRHLFEFNKLLRLIVTDSISHIKEQKKLHREFDVAGLHRTINELYNANRNFAKQCETLLHTGDELWKAVSAFNAQTGFDVQVQQLRALKKKFPGLVFPFIAVDPRRTDIFERINKLLVEEKLFTGIKIYPPNGYSAAHPMLYGPETESEYKRNSNCIYKFCADRGIPVTAHCNYVGFATLAKSATTSGWILRKGSPVWVNEETIPFNVPITQWKEAIKERSNLFGHPAIWEKVLNRFPDLKLNLAHFGGSEEAVRYIEGQGQDMKWTEKIVELLRNPKYLNLYTDLSCFNEYPNRGVTLKKFVDDFWNKNPELKSKFLYGSDFIMLMLFDDSMDGYYERFKQLFGDDFSAISQANPARFLLGGNM